MSEARAVKFQHRIATGHSILGQPFQVETKDPTDLDPKSSKTVKTQYRHHKPVPTKLVIDDALVLSAPPTPDGSAPRVTLVYLNGNSMAGADWHNAVSFEVDVPHFHAEGAEESERFWFAEDEVVRGAKKLVTDLLAECEWLKAQLATTTEGRDAALEALADAKAAKPVETKQYSDGSSATGTAPLPDQSPAQQAAQAPAPEPDVTTLLDAAPAAPEAPPAPEPTE